MCTLGRVAVPLTELLAVLAVLAIAILRILRWRLLGTRHPLRSRSSIIVLILRSMTTIVGIVINCCEAPGIGEAARHCA